MKRRFLILACALFVAEVAYLLATMRGAPVEARAGGAIDAHQSAGEQEIARQRAEYEKQTRERVGDLVKLEIEQRQRSQLENRRRENLLDLDVLLQTKAVAWSAILATNWPAYEALRSQAAASPSRTIPCTLCDGRGLMAFCVVCEGSGKCVYCKGTGRTPFGEVCPICRGSGKCYLCFGAGKMPCLFCDDGVVYLKGPLPSARMPIPSAATIPHEDEKIVPAGPGPVASAAVSVHEPQTPAQPLPSATPPTAASGEQVRLAAVLILCLALGFRTFAQRIANVLNTHFNPWTPTSVAAARVSPSVLLEEESFSRFAESFRVGPTGRVSGDSSADAASVSDFLSTTPKPTHAVSQETKELLATIAKSVDMARGFLMEINRSAELGGKQKLLVSLSAEVASLKDKSGVPELLPIWQMACALEGLLNQLIRKADNINASTLSTAVQAVDLMGTLCIPSLRPDLVSAPAVRLLAVDDDPVSRRAVSLALKKVFNEPNLATNGEEGLALATQQSYDAIFLDVGMPGMDGFELCSKIRQTALNRNTPVAFVTSHSDFDSRTTSNQVGGQDLIAKPFLAFEIAVKALSLVVHARLEGRDGGFGPSNERPRPPLPKANLGSEVVTRVLAPSSTSGNSWQPNNASDTSSGQVTVEFLKPSSDDFLKAFKAHAPADLQALREKLNTLTQSTDEKLRREQIEDMYLSLGVLSAGAANAQFQTTSRLGSALQGMFRKFLELPARCSSSALSVVNDGLDMLDDLCTAARNPDLANPPIRVLVVDDDPIARRAISAAVQLVFERPVSVPSGEAAVALAAEKPFDLIFLDVLMPGMDGYTVCPKIHETIHNCHTPVVFVTSNSDAESRDRAIESGGVGFIVKSALSVEITVTALIFAVRARLHHMQPHQTPQEAVPL